MNSQQIKYFLAVAKYKNFTEAAKYSFVSQPAIKKQIALMEQELGLQLFKRDTRSVIITPAGEILRDAFIQMQKTYNDAIDYAHRVDKGEDGIIRVGYINGLILEDIPEALRCFGKEYPNVEIIFKCLSFSELKEGLDNNLIDIGITLLLDVHNDPDLEWEKISAIPDGYAPDPSSMLLMVESGKGVALLDKLTFDNIANKDTLRFFELEILIDVLVVWKKENPNPLIPIFSSFLIETSDFEIKVGHG